MRNHRARRYILRLARDGSARVTVPSRGSLRDARAFAERNTGWLEQQLLRKTLHPSGPAPWTLGTEILFRGQPTRLECAAGQPGKVRLGTEFIEVADVTGNLRQEVQRHLWRLASAELALCVQELAALHGAPVRRIMIRDQRSRWGSCSRRGTISLNWRLIQAPESVRDYLVLHELAHLKEMNHSRKFWAEVERLCPAYRSAERWLKSNAKLLR